MIQTFPSPSALLTERARMMREEVAVGHLRLAIPPERFVSDKWRPLSQGLENQINTRALHWLSNEQGMPITEIVLQDLTLRSDPPIVYHEEDDKLHWTDGPAVKWSDDTCCYCLRGIAIAAPMYKRWKKGNLPPQRVLNLDNQAVMSVLLEQMDLSALLTADGVKVVVHDHDERWGTLRTLTFKRWNRMTLVEVVNRSPEPDGSYKHYWLQVDELCRPIYKDSIGTAQKQTALNAVASTFGMTGEEYAELLGDES